MNNVVEGVIIKTDIVKHSSSLKEKKQIMKFVKSALKEVMGQRVGWHQISLLSLPLAAGDRNKK